ncbi:MAG TPA: hypothetical protein VG406_01805 [Isosphaeraceae bacterium]|jgi:hypothetical protein|nr:hypothetical protein [Isosphaeraceae bacterium]
MAILAPTAPPVAHDLDLDPIDPADRAWWAAQQADDADAWDLHPVVADADLAAEAAYREAEARRYAAEPTDAEMDALLAELAAEALIGDGLPLF